MSPEAAELALLRYPIGGPRRAESFTAQERSAAIEGIRQLPQSLRSAVAAFSEEQLETPYRPGGWTVRQLVHHVADSHMNAYVRVRLALTEDWPTIIPYQEKPLGGARRCLHGGSVDLTRSAAGAPYPLGATLRFAR